MTTIERDVQQTCVALMRQLGFKVYLFSDRRTSRTVVTPGVPDAYFRHAGKYLRGWIEFKRPGGKQRPEQVQFQKDALSCGETYLLVDAVSALWDWLIQKGFVVET